MAHINKVMLSINGHDDATCVDIFLRPDGTFGLEEYRRGDQTLITRLNGQQ